MSRSTSSSSRRAGFTLVELMIVVAIVSIMAAVGFPSFSQWVKQSKTVEATGFLAEVKARQESYRFDFGRYCSVSANQDELFPAVTPTADLQEWTVAAMATGLGQNWTQLGAIPSGRSSRFVYSSVADAPFGSLPAARGFSDDRGYTNNDFWFITTARGDLDGDGLPMTMESYSHTKGIWVSTGNGVE
jgi:prepilin-type N-terminal cleavage/methylation domain-containing protein